MRARELCTGPGRWTQRAFARNRYGHRVRLDSASAVRFCAAGALLRATVELLDADPDDFFDQELPKPEPLRLALGCVGELFGSWVLSGWQIGYRQIDGRPELAPPADDPVWCPYTWPDLIVLANDLRRMRADIIVETFAVAERWLEARLPEWLFPDTWAEEKEGR